MSERLKILLKKKTLNGWNLFWLITGPISILLIIAMQRVDLSTGQGISSMISLSVRWAIPWLYIAFAASSLHILFPGPLSQWLLRNRKIFGLCFAAAMAWQGSFIVWLTTAQREYYIQEVYVLRDVIEGLLGYGFLIAMTLTTFMFLRKRMKPRQWKRLHKIGIYSLWIYAFSVYWWALFDYPNPRWVDYFFYWTGFLAWGLRAAAWRKKLLQRATKSDPNSSPKLAFVLLGTLIICAGLILVTFGGPWQKASRAFMTGFDFSNWLELYLPYWPFEPFIPLFIILLGTWLTTTMTGTSDQ
jgi:hypothetical protein